MPKTLVWFAAIALVATTAAAQERTNLQIFNDLSKQVKQYPYFTIFDDVNVSIDSGVVTLTGRVTHPFKKNEIEARLAKVDGVGRVDNEIEALPASVFDDTLRLRIARVIYGNLSFWQYSTMTNPPIHIIVERGRVTLTGVVLNDVERMLVRSLAMGTGALSVTNDLKTEAEAKAALATID
jgi:hyperosmotically inducible protein